MNFTPASSRSFRFDADSMPASAATTIAVSSRPCRCWNWRTIGTMVVVSAVLPSQTSNFQGESGAIDEQTDHDLWIDATLLRVPDFAQVIFLLRFEVQGRHVVQNQGQVPAGNGTGEASRRDDAAVVASDRRGEMSLDCFVRECICTEIVEDSCGVGFRGGFDDPGDDQISEHGVAHLVESESVVDGGEHVVEQPRTRAECASGRRHRRGGRALGFGAPVGDLVDPGDAGGDLEVEYALLAVGDAAGSGEQHTEFGIGVRRPDVFDDLDPAAVLAGDLNRDRSRCGPHLPHVCHRRDAT